MSDRAQACWNEAHDSTGVESALWAIAAALCENANAIGYAARHLGTNDAATPMGALEALGRSIMVASDRIADALERPS